MAVDVKEASSATGEEFVAGRINDVPPSGIRKFFDIVATMKDVISLGIGEPDFVSPKPIVQAGIKSLEQGHTGYTSNSGILNCASFFPANSMICTV